MCFNAINHFIQSLFSHQKISYCYQKKYIMHLVVTEEQKDPLFDCTKKSCVETHYMLMRYLGIKFKLMLIILGSPSFP